MSSENCTKKIKTSTVWHHILYKTPPQSGAGFFKTIRILVLAICKKTNTGIDAQLTVIQYFVGVYRLF